MFNIKLKEYKEKQSDLEAQMALYTEADESFYLNANILLHAVKKAQRSLRVLNRQHKGKF